MDQVWFEFRDVRKRKLDGSVWIPLRAIQTQTNSVDYGHSGYVEAFFGTGTVAVWTQFKDEAEKQGWMDVGISHDHSGGVDEDRYISSDAFENYGGTQIGVHLVLQQRSIGDELREWHLHHDLVLTLGLKREGDTWVVPDEGYQEAVRLSRNDDQRPNIIEIRTEYLKDYLNARGMALYVTSYRSRKAVVEDQPQFGWEENPIVVNEGLDRWEGRIMPIHEGGQQFGEEVKVFNIARDGVGEDEDVPTLSSPSDGDIRSTSWTRTFDGRKLYQIEGELWRNEWVGPGPISPRVRGDETTPSVFFITDATGTLESKETLRDGIKWLWFRPDVVMTLAHRRGGGLSWYTRDTGEVRCSPQYGVHFGVNALGLVNALAKDVAYLPDWQQRAWAAHNVGPDGGVSDELLMSQMQAQPAETSAPESYLEPALQALSNAIRSAHGIEIIRPHDHHDKLFPIVHRFRATDQPGFFALAKDLARLTADSFDAAAIQTIVPPPEGVRWGSLKSLEKLAAKHCGSGTARRLIAPLVGVYELRHPDAHLPASDLSESYVLASVDQAAPFLLQGYQMLHSCVSALRSIESLFLDSKVSS